MSHRATHNVWVGQRPRPLRRRLRRLIRALGRPTFLALVEAHKLEDTVADYTRVALDDDEHLEAGNTVLLVRPDVAVVRRRRVVVDGPRWVVAKHGRWHDPRRWVGATLEEDGERRDVLVVHRCPNGDGVNRPAFEAEEEALVAWVRKRVRSFPGRPIELVGDHNARRDYLEALARRLLALDGVDSAEVAVRGIDGALVLNAGARDVRKLTRRFGSDAHRPVRYTLTTKGTP